MTGKSVVDAAPRRAWARQRVGDPGNRTIGVIAPGYGLERVSYMIPSARRTYVKLTRLPWQRLERRGTFLEETVQAIGPRVDLVHTFNQIVANRPFVVSSEMELPRYLMDPPTWQLRLGHQLLAADRCRGIWPLSEAARNYLLRRFEAAGHAELASKVAVFRGAVAPGPADTARVGYAEHGPLRLLFVGGDGLRKGLGPTLAAAAQLRAGGAEVEVTVVGSATAHSYLVPGATFDTAPVAALLTQPWVRHHAALPNPAIRALMATHDLFVFPTMDESLGWVAAEAAASGLPTITTNVFALPELVADGTDGWTIPVDLDADRRWRHIGRADASDAWLAVQDHLANRLVEIIGAVAADRGEVAVRGRRAQARIGALYGIENAAATLTTLYERAIAAG